MEPQNSCAAHALQQCALFVTARTSRRWSNIIYTLVGSWTCGLALNDVLRSPKGWRFLPFGSRLPNNPLLSVLCGLTWMALGVCSFLFHASHSARPPRLIERRR